MGEKKREKREQAFERFGSAKRRKRKKGTGAQCAVTVSVRKRYKGNHGYVRKKRSSGFCSKMVETEKEKRRE